MTDKPEELNMAYYGPDGELIEPGTHDVLKSTTAHLIEGASVGAAIPFAFGLTALQLTNPLLEASPLAEFLLASPIGPVMVAGAAAGASVVESAPAVGNLARATAEALGAKIDHRNDFEDSRLSNWSLENSREDKTNDRWGSILAKLGHDSSKDLGPRSREITDAAWEDLQARLEHAREEAHGQPQHAKPISNTPLPSNDRDKNR